MEMEEGELSDEGGPLETPPSPPPMASQRRSTSQWANHSNPPGIQVTFQTGARDLPDLVRSIDGGDHLPLDRSLTERMEKRAKRFNLSGWKSQVNFDLIQGLYQSLGIPEDERDGKLDKDQRMFRLEALHVHGVGKMVAEDIYDYFKEFNPISYEWVDSKSVNVGWALSSTSAQALLALSRPILEAEDEAMEVNERVVDENGDQEPRAKPEPLTKEELLAKFERSKDEPFTRDEIPGPIPAGSWRLGKPSQQVTTIFMRIATVKDSASGHPTEDKHLFQKNRQLRMEGGLLSASRKRKLHEVVQFDRERVAEEERAKKYTGPVGKNPWGSIAKDWTQPPKARDFADELQLFAQQRGIGIPGPGPLRPLVKDWDQPQDPNEEFYEEEIEEDDAIWRKKLKRPRMSMVADAVEVKRPPAKNRLHVHQRLSNPSRIEIYEQEEEEDDDDYEDEPLVPARDLRMTIKTKTDPDAPESNQRLTERFHGSVHRRLGEKRRNSDDSLERDNGEDLRGELTDRHLRGKNMLIQVARSDGEEDREVERINKTVPALVSIKQEKMEDEAADRSIKTIRRIQSPVEPLESKKEVREQIRRQERQKSESTQLDRSRSSRVSDRNVAKKKPLSDREMIRKPSRDTGRKDSSRSISSRRPGIKIKKEKTSDDERKKRKTKKRDDSSSSSDDDSSSGDSSSDSSSSDTSSSGSSDSSDSDSDSSSSSSSSDSEDEKAKKRKKSIGSKKKLSSYSDRSKLQKRGISRREDIRAGRKTSVLKKDTQDHNSKGRGSKKVDDKKKSSKDDSGLREKLKKYLKNAKEKRSTSKKK